jgi:hypothetical protein
MFGTDPIAPVARCFDAHRLEQHTARCMEWSDQELCGDTEPPQELRNHYLDTMHVPGIAAHGSLHSSQSSRALPNQQGGAG